MEPLFPYSTGEWLTASEYAQRERERIDREIRSANRWIAFSAFSFVAAIVLGIIW